MKLSKLLLVGGAYILLSRIFAGAPGGNTGGNTGNNCNGRYSLNVKRGNPSRTQYQAFHDALDILVINGLAEHMTLDEMTEWCRNNTTEPLDYTEIIEVVCGGRQWH